jgi:CMP-N-acetylneuraminic acid synthetase
MPYKWFELGLDNYLQGIRANDLRKEYYNLPRQSFPSLYEPNGYVDILKVDHILKGDGIHGDKIIGFETDSCIEIDTQDDLNYLEYLISHGKIDSLFLKG